MEKSATSLANVEDRAEEGYKHEDAGALQRALRGAVSVTPVARQDISPGNAQQHRREDREDRAAADTNVVEEATNEPPGTNRKRTTTNRPPNLNVRRGLSVRRATNKWLQLRRTILTRETGSGGPGERPPPHTD